MTEISKRSNSFGTLVSQPGLLSVLSINTQLFRKARSMTLVTFRPFHCFRRASSVKPTLFGQPSDAHPPNLRPTVPTSTPTYPNRKLTQQPLEPFGIAG